MMARKYHHHHYHHCRRHYHYGLGEKIPNFTLDLRDTPFAAIYTTESVGRGWNKYLASLKTDFISSHQMSIVWNNYGTNISHQMSI